MERCPNLQAGLYDLHMSCDPGMVRTPSPFWDFAWSDTNRSGFQQIIVPGQGKVRTIQVVYDQRILESDVDDVDGTVLKCVATKKRGNLSTSYTIDPTDTVEASELMDAADFIYVCENNPEIVIRKIKKLMNAVMEKLATRLVTRSIALLGGWSADVQGTVSSKYLQVKTVKDGTIDPMPNTWQDIKFAMQQMGFCDSPSVIISGANLYKYAQLMESGCCTASGLDIGDIASRFGMATLYDKRVNKAIGANKAWVIQAGSLIPLYYTFNNNGVSEAAGAAFTPQFIGANYAKGVIQDIETGFPMDWTISDNCGALSIIVRGNADIQTLPSDMFAPGDDYEGVTGFTGIQIANA